MKHENDSLHLMTRIWGPVTAKVSHILKPASCWNSLGSTTCCTSMLGQRKMTSACSNELFTTWIGRAAKKKVWKVLVWGAHKGAKTLTTNTKWKHGQTFKLSGGAIGTPQTLNTWNKHASEQHEPHLRLIIGLPKCREQVLHNSVPPKYNIWHPHVRRYFQSGPWHVTC